MSTMKKMVSALALTAMLGACAGRDPQIISAVQPGDQNLNCDTISAEMMANTQRIQQLQKESSDTTGKNVAFGVVGAILFWPALFAMDFKDGAGKDAQALQARQSFLASMLAQRHCAVTG